MPKPYTIKSQYFNFRYNYTTMVCMLANHKVLQHTWSL